MASSAESGRLPLTAKAALAGRIWIRFLWVRWGLHREPLPELVAALGRPARRSRRHHSAARLARSVDKALHVGARRPTCLVSALVLYRLLREQGDPAELVIGLPEAARNEEAHAWVELGGRDVGPPPGRGHHTEMARFA